ncbi:MAG: DUF2231 domain-containing protein [Vicinamibacterales bacterium]
MPSIAAFHPQVVHFAVALLVIGVVFRLVSLTGRLSYTGPAATSLIVIGTIASVLAVRSGTDAHGPVERVPGARAAVMDHEEWGIRARNIFLGVAVLELIAAALASRKPQQARVFAMGAAAIGLVGVGALYEAGEHGGELVYNHAGGIGIRSGNPQDVGNLLVAGLYHQAGLDRAAGKGPDGAALIDLAAARNPQNFELQLISIEWTTEVKKDPADALRRLDLMTLPAGDNRLKIRAAMARSAALAASGNLEAAKQVLLTLKGEYPNNQQIQRRLDELAK